MKNILIIDTETTGLDPLKGCKIIEVGAMLYNVKHKQILQNFSTLLPCEENPVQDINHIDPEWTRSHENHNAAIQFLKDMAKNSDAIVAHNASFDKKFLRTIPELDSEFWVKRWICTKNDFKWPVQLYRNRLQDICTAMGVLYSDAHRALTDCNFLAMCFSKVSDLEMRLKFPTKNTFDDNGNTFR